MIYEQSNGIICLFARCSCDEGGQLKADFLIRHAPTGSRPARQNRVWLRMGQWFGLMDHRFPSLSLFSAPSSRMWLSMHSTEGDAQADHISRTEHHTYFTPTVLRFLGERANRRKMTYTMRLTELANRLSDNRSRCQRCAPEVVHISAECQPSAPASYSGVSHSSGGGVPRSRLVAEARRFASRRRSRLAALGLVGTRGTSGRCSSSSLAAMRA